ncbi:hypothetical protein D3C77_87300 [compost metagenome]
MQADGLLIAITQGGHGHHDTQYRRDNTEAWHAIGNAGHGMGGMLKLFLHAQQLHVEQAFELVRCHVAGGHDAQVIADVRSHALIAQHRRVLGKNRTGSGVFDIGFDRHHAFAPTLVENLVDQPQHFYIEGVGKARTEHLQGLLDYMHGHVTRVGLEERTKSRTANDQHFKRLDQRCNLAVRENISAEHAREYDDDADNFSHR